VGALVIGFSPFRAGNGGYPHIIADIPYFVKTFVRQGKNKLLK
jgi:hypothetical protein